MRVLCVAAAGGHLEQMLECLDAFAGHEILLAHYDWRTFDDLEDPRITRHVGIFLGGDNALTLSNKEADRMRLLIGTFLSTFQWLWILITFRPHVVFSTGAEIGIIPLWLGRFFFRARCIFLETACRQDSPSGTGPLVYPVCHVVFVQSESILKHLGPKARCVGSLL